MYIPKTQVANLGDTTLVSDEVVRNVRELCITVLAGWQSSDHIRKRLTVL